MLFKHRGPLPVLGVALAVFCVSEGVAAAQTTPREVALKYAVDNAESLGVKPTDMTNLASRASTAARTTRSRTSTSASGGTAWRCSPAT